MDARPAIGEVARGAAVVAAPFVCVGAVLVVAGLASAPAMAVALLVGVVAAGGLVWRHLRDIGRLRLAAEALAAESAEIEPHLPENPLLAPLTVTLARLRGLSKTRRAQAHVERQAEETIIDSLPDPLLVLDGSARIVRVNGPARSLLGAHCVGRDLAVVLRHPAVLDAVQETISTGESQAVEVTMAGVVDRDYDVRTKTLPSAAANGGRLVLTFHDLTDAKRSNQLRADFVANASHELRSPLSALVGFIETLRGPAADDAAARERFLGIMQEQADRMARLIDALLSLSRIELDEHTPPTARSDLVTIARRTAEGLELRAAARHMRISLETEEPDMPATADPDQIAQVLHNLLDNGIKYGRQGSIIRVVVRREDRGPSPLHRVGAGGVIAISVHNEGEGVPAEHLPRLTERFYRVDPGRSRSLGGTGLGLAIVKHIVNRHRGALSIESDDERGTTFTVHLPALPSRSPDEAH